MTKKPTAFDLAQLDTVQACNKGVEVELLHPVTRIPLGMFITVVGKDSDTFREYLREVSDNAQRQMSMDRKRGIDIAAKSAAQQEKEDIELLAACTVSWRGIVLGGEELPFNVANAIKVYTGWPWIRVYVDVAIADLSRFLT